MANKFQNNITETERADLMAKNARRLRRRAKANEKNFNVRAAAPAMKRISYLRYGFGTCSLASVFGGQHEVI